MSPSTTSAHPFNTPRNSDSTTSLGTLFQHLTTLQYLRCDTVLKMWPHSCHVQRDNQSLPQLCKKIEGPMSDSWKHTLHCHLLYSSKEKPPPKHHILLTTYPDTTCTSEAGHWYEGGHCSRMSSPPSVPGRCSTTNYISVYAYVNLP